MGYGIYNLSDFDNNSNETIKATTYQDNKSSYDKWSSSSIETYNVSINGTKYDA